MNTSKENAKKLIQKGDFKKARSLLKFAAGKTTNDPEIWYLLSVAAGQLGFYEEVIDASKRVLAIKPNLPAAHANLANGLVGIRHYADAIQHYRKALALEPNNVSIIYSYAQTLYCVGEKTESINQFLQVLGRMPAHADSHYRIGTILVELTDFVKAIPHLQKAEQLNPGLPDIYFKLAEAYRETAQLEEAENTYQKAIQKNQNKLGSFIGLITVLRYQGKTAASLDTCREGLLQLPGNSDMLAIMADLHERQGELQQAYDIVHPIVASNQLNVGIADVFSRICRKFSVCDEALIYGNKVISAPNFTNTLSKARVHFSLGKMLDKLQRFDEAFGHYEQANVLYSLSFDSKAHEALIEALMNTYSQEAVSTMPRSSCDTERPVFIIGMPRSGTSLVEQIIASHSRVHGAGELNDINLIAASLRQTKQSQEKYPQCTPSLTTAELDGLAKRYIEKLQSLSGDALRVTDKMPHNFLHVGLIAQLFPRAHIIHCLRNPLDTCLSIYFQSFNRIHTYATDLTSLGVFYCAYRRLMNHWQQVLDLPFLEISYEELVIDQADVSRRMIEFCGLEWEDQCLQFHKTERTVSTASYDQVSTPIYTRSVERWRNYEAHLAPLRKALAPCLE
jgi:tetratricopeptide (TPR) repeat protein